MSIETDVKRKREKRRIKYDVQRLSGKRCSRSVLIFAENVSLCELGKRKLWLHNTVCHKDCLLFNPRHTKLSPEFVCILMKYNFVQNFIQNTEFVLQNSNTKFVIQNSKFYSKYKNCILNKSCLIWGALCNAPFYLSTSGNQVSVLYHRDSSFLPTCCFRLPYILELWFKSISLLYRYTYTQMFLYTRLPRALLRQVLKTKEGPCTISQLGGLAQQKMAKGRRKE